MGLLGHTAWASFWSPGSLCGTGVGPGFLPDKARWRVGGGEHEKQGQQFTDGTSKPAHLPARQKIAPGFYFASALVPSSRNNRLTTAWGRFLLPAFGKKQSISTDFKATQCSLGDGAKLPLSQGQSYPSLFLHTKEQGLSCSLQGSETRAERSEENTHCSLAPWLDFLPSLGTWKMGF